MQSRNAENDEKKTCNFRYLKRMSNKHLKFNILDVRLFIIASLLTAASSYLLIDNTWLNAWLSPKVKEETSIGKIIYRNRLVSKRDQQQSLWLPAETGDYFSLGDSLATGEGATARIELNDEGIVELSPGSLIRFEPKSNERQVLSVDGVFRIIAKKPIQLLLKTEEKMLTLKPETKLTLVNKPDRISIEVATGEAQLQAVEKEMPSLRNASSPENEDLTSFQEGLLLKSNSQLVVSKDGLHLEEFNPLFFTEPNQSELGLGSNQNLQVTFSWKGIEDGTTYAFEIAKDVDFSNLVFSTLTQNQSIQLNISESGQYYYRVWQKDKTTNGKELRRSLTESLLVHRQQLQTEPPTHTEEKFIPDLLSSGDILQEDTLNSAQLNHFEVDSEVQMVKKEIPLAEKILAAPIWLEAKDNKNLEDVYFLPKEKNPEIHFQWQRGNQRPNLYQFEIAEDPGFIHIRFSNQVQGTEFKFTVDKPGKLYARIYAIQGAAKSAASITKEIRVLDALYLNLNSQDHLNLSEIGDGETLKLSWPPHPRAIRYFVYWENSGRVQRLETNESEVLLPFVANQKYNLQILAGIDFSTNSYVTRESASTGSFSEEVLYSYQASVMRVKRNGPRREWRLSLGGGQSSLVQISDQEGSYKKSDTLNLLGLNFSWPVYNNFAVDISYHGFYYQQQKDLRSELELSVPLFLNRFFISKLQLGLKERAYSVFFQNQSELIKKNLTRLYYSSHVTANLPIVRWNLISELDLGLFAFVDNPTQEWYVKPQVTLWWPERKPNWGVFFNYHLENMIVDQQKVFNMGDSEILRKQEDLQLGLNYRSQF